MEKYRKGEENEDTKWSEEKVITKRKYCKTRIIETRKGQEKQRGNRYELKAACDRGNGHSAKVNLLKV